MVVLEEPKCEVGEMHGKESSLLKVSVVIGDQVDMY